MAVGQDPRLIGMTQLLGDIANHPTLRRKHQLAHVSLPVAYVESHTKKDFFQQMNTSEHMTFVVWPTAGSVCYHHTPH